MSIFRVVVLPIELKCGLTEKNKKKYCSVPLKNVLSHSELMRGAFHTIRKMNVMSGSAFRCILTTSYPFIRYFNSEMSHRSMNAMTPQGWARASAVKCPAALGKATRLGMIMVLPLSHSPSENKPSQARIAALSERQLGCNSHDAGKLPAAWWLPFVRGVEDK